MVVVLCMVVVSVFAIVYNYLYKQVVYEATAQVLVD